MFKYTFKIWQLKKKHWKWVFLKVSSQKMCNGVDELNINWKCWCISWKWRSYFQVANWSTSLCNRRNGKNIPATNNNVAEYFFSIEEYFILLFSIVNEKRRVYWFPFSLTKTVLEKTTVWDVSVWWQNIVLSTTSRTCLLVRHMRLNGKKDDTLCCHPRHKQFFFQTKISVRYPSSPFTTAVDWKKYFTVFARHVAFYHQSI